MRIHIRLALAALAATAAMAAIGGSATARNLSISNQQFRVTYRSLEFLGSGTVRCAVTFEGSFHTRTIIKTLRSLIGHITRATVKRPCNGGEEFVFNGVERLEPTTLANTLPWHVRYEGFGGTLPNITSVRLSFEGARWRLRDPIFGILCIFTTGGARGFWFGTASRNTVTGVIDSLAPSGTIRFDPESSGLCGSEGRIGAPAGDGVITLLGASTKITVTLI